MGHDTKPDVFIIESDTLKNEKKRYSEGELLCHLLKMMGKRTEYRYIRTTKELQAMAREFQRSEFRYLHLGCHGSVKGFGLTLDSVPFAAFAGIVGPVIQDRRLFLSACSIGQPTLARTLFERYRPYSITAPTEDIYFSDAAVVWSALYRLLFKHDAGAIRGGLVRESLRKICALHDVGFVHFGRIAKRPYFRAYYLGKKP